MYQAASASVTGSSTVSDFEWDFAFLDRFVVAVNDVSEGKGFECLQCGVFIKGCPVTLFRLSYRFYCRIYNLYRTNAYG